MQTINYTNYPLILFTSFDKKDEIEGLPFAVDSEKAKAFLAQSKEIHNLFGYIGAMNTIKGDNNCTYYYLNEQRYRQIEFDDSFRERFFSNFFNRQNLIKPKYGVILLPNGGQYVYALLSTKETQQLYNQQGRYIAASLFKNNTFAGFEEGIIGQDGIDVFPTAYYSNHMDPGGYISFVLITLGYAEDKTFPLLKTTIKEKIDQL